MYVNRPRVVTIDTSAAVLWKRLPVPSLSTTSRASLTARRTSSVPVGTVPVTLMVSRSSAAASAWVYTWVKMSSVHALIAGRVVGHRSRWSACRR